MLLSLSIFTLYIFEFFLGVGKVILSQITWVDESLELTYLNLLKFKNLSQYLEQRFNEKISLHLSSLLLECHILNIIYNIYNIFIS